jgi:hypothetical protein
MATDYVTPDGKERHVAENLRNAFDYLITKWVGTKSSPWVQDAWKRQAPVSDLLHSRKCEGVASPTQSAARR